MYFPKYSKKADKFAVEYTLHEYSWTAYVFGQEYSGVLDRHHLWSRLKYEVGRMRFGISEGIWISEYPVERQYVNGEWSGVGTDLTDSPIRAILFHPEPDVRWRKSFRRRFIMHAYDSPFRYSGLDNSTSVYVRSMSQPGLIGPSFCVDMSRKKKIVHTYLCIRCSDGTHKQIDIPKSYYDERGLWVDPSFEYLAREAINTGNLDLIR